ncbi:MAG: glycosyl/glycerophosphate transferase, partial [Microbacterium sp.]
MASFSFGAGNAAKLLRIPLYLAGRLATWIIPRSRDEWVFGSAVGIADGALALWDHARGEGEQAVWIVADDRQAAEAAARGIPTVRKGSAAAFWRTARARVIVVTHGFGDVDRYAAAGAFIVQLWHGIPLKRIGLDSPATVRTPVAALNRVAGPVIAAMYRATQRRIGLIPAASHLVRGRLESAFALSDENVPVTGEPRVDVLSSGSPESRRRAALDGLSAALHPDAPSERDHLSGARDAPMQTAAALSARSIVLYAPTWRDGAPDPAIPSRDDWTAIHAMLEEHDAMLLVRSHPLGAGDYGAGLGDRVRMLGSDRVADVTPLLPAVDVLITDYSSLVFDALLVPVPTAFLAPDAAA